MINNKDVIVRFKEEEFTEKLGLTMTLISAKKSWIYFMKNVKKDVVAQRYHLNSNVEFTKELLEGILINKKRYRYGACPCRLVANYKEVDLDIIKFSYKKS